MGNNLIKKLALGGALALGANCIIQCFIAYGCNRVETKTEYSDILYQNARVTQKEQTHYIVTTTTISPAGTTVTVVPVVEAHIRLEGKEIFDVRNPEICNQFNLENIAKVGYKEKYKVSTEKNKITGKEKTTKVSEGYEFVSASQIEQDYKVEASK